MIWIILTLGFVIRTISLNQSLWLDEAINVLAAKNFSLIGIITEYARADFHPPGFFVILWIWTKIFGIEEIAVRTPSVIFGVLTIYTTYLIGQKLNSKTLGLLSALILAINPIHIYYSQEARMYVMAVLAVTLNMFFFCKLVKNERVNLFILVCSNTFILFSDYVAYLIFPAQLIFLLIHKQSKIIKTWIVGLLGAILIWSIWIPVLINQLKIGSETSSNLPAWKIVVGGFNLQAIPLTFVKFIIGRISLTNKLVYAAVLLPICSLFGYLIYKGAKSLDDINRRLLLAWIIIPPILAIIISFVIPIYSYFRLLFVLPSFIVLTALGVLSFKNKLKYIFLITVLVTEFFCSLVYLFNPIYQREDWRGLIKFFKGQVKSSVILFESSGILPPFDYYAKGELKAKGALKDFPARVKDDLIDLGEILKDSDNVYLVDYLVEISDPNRFVSNKLINLGFKQVDTKNFTGVGFVYHYVK